MKLLYRQGESAIEIKPVQEMGRLNFSLLGKKEIFIWIKGMYPGL